MGHSRPTFTWSIALARSLVASDDFNRAGPGLGANWEELTTGGGNGAMAIAASTVVVGPNAGGDGLRQAARHTGTYTDDQYSSIVIAELTNITSDYSIGVIARASADTDAGRDFYQALVFADSAGPNYTTQLSKIVNGTHTTLHSAAVAWVTTDRIELECEGTTIRLAKNGTPLGGSFTVTDSSLTTGKPGVAGSGDIDGDNWEGGNITAGGNQIAWIVA